MPEFLQKKTNFKKNALNSSIDGDTKSIQSSLYN